MEHDHYLVATLKPWNIKVFNEKIKHFPGNWHLVSEPEELTLEFIKTIKPKYVFFPHWSDFVPDKIIQVAECIGFHEADLPFGRGGSPMQNLIARGFDKTVISAFRMSEKLDAGPIYLKVPFSLVGLAEEIYIRYADATADMIQKIAMENPKPSPQEGESTFFKRRTPEQSEISSDKKDLKEIFDHIRMLDAESYPKAFLEHGGFRFEFSRPALKTDSLITDVKITKIEDPK